MFGLLEFCILLILAFESIWFLYIIKNRKILKNDRIDILNFLALLIALTAFKMFFHFLFNAIVSVY